MSNPVCPPSTLKKRHKIFVSIEMGDHSGKSFVVSPTNREKIFGGDFSYFIGVKTSESIDSSSFFSPRTVFFCIQDRSYHRCAVDQDPSVIVALGIRSLSVCLSVKTNERIVFRLASKGETEGEKAFVLIPGLSSLVFEKKHRTYRDNLNSLSSDNCIGPPIDRSIVF